MRIQKRRCKHCRCFFEVCKKVKKHEYCKKDACQKARRRKWQKRKIASDQTYRRDQKEAQNTWLDKRPDYWKQYRASHSEYTERNRNMQRKRNRSKKVRTAAEPSFSKIAKMDALNDKKHILSGRYRLIPLTGEKIAKMDALIVEIGLIKGGYETFYS